MVRDFDLAQTGEPKIRHRPRLNVLILHDNHDLAQVRRTSFNHGFCLLKYAPWNNYTLQSIRDPVPAWLRSRHFDLIVLDTTFLCWRWTYPRDENFGRVLREYAFVGDSDALKVALPQDEYDHQALLDQWMTDWRVDRIYSVCFEHRDVLYPLSTGRSEIVEGMTGYIDDADVAMMSRAARPFEERGIDVGYRARSLPPYFGRFGRLKADIGDRFKTSFAGSGLRLDISVDGRDTFIGDDWLRFLGNCRFTLGCESGSSLLDPTGDINRACRAYLAEHPRAGFEEVEAACFSGQDLVRTYSAISPRIFEAALAGNCQILVAGSYMGVLRPDEHYIPWHLDAANDAALEPALGDWRRAKERVAACLGALLGNDRLHYRGFVRELLDWSETKLPGRGSSPHRRVRAAEPPTDAAEKLHVAAQKAVRASVARNTPEDDEETYGSGDGEGATPVDPKICLLALSPIVDDPRVRRQGDLFYGRDWGVTAVGMPGGHSAAPIWRILSKPAAGRCRIAHPTAANQDAGSPGPVTVIPALAAQPIASGSFARWRHGVSDRLSDRPQLWKLALRSWRGVRFGLLLPRRSYAAVRRAQHCVKPVVRSMAYRFGLLDRLRPLLDSSAVTALRQRGISASLRYASRMLAVRIRPQHAEQVLWDDLPYSPQLRAMYEAASRVDADIWVANDWTALPLAARLAREKGGIFVYDTHEFATEEFAEQAHWRRWRRAVVCAVEAKYIRDAAVVSAVSDGIARHLDALYDLPRPALAIRNTPSYEAHAFRSTGSHARVLYHGIVAPGRGLEAAIDSVAQWESRFDLTIRGPDNPEFTPLLRHRIATLGLEDRVHIVPPVPMTALVREAAAFDVGFFALPGHSHHNQFALPNKFFEYTMAGLALCMTDLPEMARLMQEYDLGVTFPKVEPGLIAQAVNALTPERIDHCKRNALAAARELCWDREAERLVSAYTAAVSRVAIGA